MTETEQRRTLIEAHLARQAENEAPRRHFDVVRTLKLTAVLIVLGAIFVGLIIWTASFPNRDY